jgi:dihydropteroate synthase
MESSAPDSALPATVAADARVYLAPAAVGPLSALAPMVETGSALPLAGGPLGFAVCEIAIRDSSGVARTTASLAQTRRWAAQQGGAVEARIDRLLDTLCRPRRALRGEPLSRPLLMGIINATPDSFSDGGEHFDAAAAIAHGQRLAHGGADILDVGGESTRPGAAPVPPREEAARVLPVLQGLSHLRASFPRLLLSIDTRHAAVMQAALAQGADLINDVTALTGDPDSLAVAANSGAAVALMHMQGEPATMNLAPRYADVALDVFDYLEGRIAACRETGIAPERLLLDPGIGFGKRGAQNLAVLRSLALYHGLGCPLLLGASRKALGSRAESALPPKERLPTSLAAALHALNLGVQVLRVHDVAETRRVVELWQRLTEGRRASAEA